jgi:hypothetical protein
MLYRIAENWSRMVRFSGNDPHGLDQFSILFEIEPEIRDIDNDMPLRFSVAEPLDTVKVQPYGLYAFVYAPV